MAGLRLLAHTPQGVEVWVQKRKKVPTGCGGGKEFRGVGMEWTIFHRVIVPKSNVCFRHPSHRYRSRINSTYLRMHVNAYSRTFIIIITIINIIIIIIIIVLSPEKKTRFGP